MKRLALAVAFCSLASVPAFAGMGDPSAHIKDQNAICENQRHGVGPMYPNMCLDETPPYPDARPRPMRHWGG